MWTAVTLKNNYGLDAREKGSANDTIHGMKKCETSNRHRNIYFETILP